MTKITVFGATGRTGQHLVEQALDRGCQVTAFSRSPDKLKARGENLRVVQGDLQDAARVAQAVAGADAVVSTLGPTENKPTFAVSRGTEHILAAMRQHGVRRLVISAGAGVSDPNDQPRLFGKIMNVLLKRFSRYVYEDMVKTVEIVRSSGVDWTVVRVPMLTDHAPVGEIKVGYVGKGLGPRITRADVARFMLDQVESKAYLRKAPAISN